MELSKIWDHQQNLSSTLAKCTLINVNKLVSALLSSDTDLGFPRELYSVLSDDSLHNTITDIGVIYNSDSNTYTDTDGENIGSIESAASILMLDICDYETEVYEHYIVDEILKRALVRAGATVINFYGQSIWCRTCSGQVVWMDYEMEKALTSLI